MIPPPPEPTLPEELLLLAPDPRRGRPYCRSRFLEYAMAGAALAELSLQGWITEERGRALAALVSAADLSRFVAADRTSRTAMRHLVREQWPAHAVHRNVRRDKSNQAGGGG